MCCCVADRVSGSTQIYPTPNDAPKYMVGWAVACNSAGTFISAPLLGAWADKWFRICVVGFFLFVRVHVFVKLFAIVVCFRRRATRPVMAIGLVIMIMGNFCYSLAYKVFSDTTEVNVVMLLAGRFVVGFAAGNYAVVQSYFSYATKPSQVT